MVIHSEQVAIRWNWMAWVCGALRGVTSYLFTSLAFLIATAASEIGKKPIIDTKVQWGVFVGIFVPICIGMVAFGYFAWKGEYDHLPERSEEIGDD